MGQRKIYVAPLTDDIMSNEVTVWNNLLKTVMAMPGVRVDRDTFLREKLGYYCQTQENMEKVIRQTPLAVVSVADIDRIADKCISSHVTKVTLISAAAGIPGGFALLGSVPADTAQYYYHVLALSQKLAYLYGFPSLTDKDNKLTDDAVVTLTAFVGVNLGVVVANEAINSIARRLAEQAAKRIPQMALTQTTIFPIIKQVAKWIGVKVTKESFGKGVAKVIPFLGAGLSGGLTYVTFKPGAKRLKEKLKENMYIIQEGYKSKATDAEYTEYIEEP